MTWPAYHFARIKEVIVIEQAITGYHNAKDKITWGEENPALLKRYYELRQYR